MIAVSPPIAGQDVTQVASEILQTILLPKVSEELRESGVPVEEVETAVAAARQSGVSPGEATGVFGEAIKSVGENGPIENFGGFVRAQLERGLRGKELADAIRAEHAARGIGRGRKLDSDRPGRGRGGPPDNARPGASGERGPGVGTRNPNTRRPDSAGQPPDTSATPPGRPGGDGRGAR
ncbi:MAG: hypothetical protein RQ745_04855 [Longimicrobiales bacterium]|nr:hypothetical protein [Longimicrobiales bacterium]